MRRTPTLTTAMASATMLALAAMPVTAATVDAPRLDASGSTLTWSAVDGAEGYNVYRGGTSSEHYLTTVRGTTSWEASADGTYRVTAFDEDTEPTSYSDASNPAAIELAPEPDPDPEPDDVVYGETFDDVEQGTYAGIDDLEVVDCDDGDPCLRARYRPMDRGTYRLSYREQLPAAREYTLTYDMRFDDDFEWVKGGKLPGLAADNVISGGEEVDGDGWSARLMWHTDGRFKQYLYHQDLPDQYGDPEFAEGVTLEQDRWYRVALHVRVNSSGAVDDGQVTLFLDGEEVARREDLRLRGVDRGGLIEEFYFSTFYGGGSAEWSPSRTTYAFFDDFTVRSGRHVQ